MFDKNKQSVFWSNIKPKTSFWLGLLLGVLLMFVVGFFVLLGVVLHTPETGWDDNSPAVAVNNPSNNNQAQPTSLSEIGKDEPVRGNSKAKVTLIEFSDYQCSYCVRVHETLKQLVAEYGDKVAWVYRHFPLDSIHPYARLAAQSAECAGDQDKFWEYSDDLFTNQADLGQGRSAMVAIADGLSLNMNKFNDCLDSEKYVDKVEADFQEGINNGVTGTPGTFVNGQLIKGALPLESFKEIIDQALQ